MVYRYVCVYVWMVYWYVCLEHSLKLELERKTKKERSDLEATCLVLCSFILLLLFLANTRIQVMVEKGTRSNKASRALLSSQAKTQVCRQADQVHGYNSHVEPQATVFLRLSQEASQRPQLRSIAFHCGTALRQAIGVTVRAPSNG